MTTHPPVPAAGQAPNISVKLIGLGGCGGNLTGALSRQAGQVDLIVANTDAQDLTKPSSARRILLGPQHSSGKGAGGDRLNGRAAAEESRPAITAALAGADMVVIAAGMGGGTGTGAAPVVARTARDLGALTLAFVTLPFQYERGRRMQTADEGLAELLAVADAVVVVPNQKLMAYLPPKTTLLTAMHYGTQVLRAATSGVVDMLTLPSLLQFDFSHIRRTLAQAGQAMLGIGAATGDSAAIRAVEQALRCDLLDGNLQQAQRIFVALVGGEGLGLIDANDAVERVNAMIGVDAERLVGVTINPALPPDRVQATVIAGGVTSLHQPPSRLLQRTAAPVAPAHAAARLAPAAPAALSPADLDIPPFLKSSRRGRP